MKYEHKEFTLTLKEIIQQKEKQVQVLLEQMKNEHVARFEQLDLTLEAEFERVGIDPFQPGYSSSISIGISDLDNELIDLYTVYIWECDRSFLGLTILKNLPGSKVKGELLDESIEELEKELYEYIEDHLT
ncbi:hypothetical protein [Metabacillus iocasae]|uniref:Uncharacterized protein n=1 Tax=Priestia iocasae TaxID=2291674 RepID=A0ABS2QWX3_9BACI|nr:hypothetical protein [Metabacillus iocasae]MBM7702979.1 hypothetical protein [Metabacillus iocasae]